MATTSSVTPSVKDGSTDGMTPTEKYAWLVKQICPWVDAKSTASTETDDLRTTFKSGMFDTICVGDTKAQILKRWFEVEMEVYDARFPAGAYESRLGNIELRFRWFFAWLFDYDAKYYPILPVEWNTAEAFAAHFCQQLGVSVPQMLKLAKANSILTLEALSLAYKSILRFESDLVTTFQRRARTEDALNRTNSSSSVVSTAVANLVASFSNPAPVTAPVPLDETLKRIQRTFMRDDRIKWFGPYMDSREQFAAISDVEFERTLDDDDWVVTEKTERRAFVCALSLLTSWYTRATKDVDPQSFVRACATLKRRLSQFAAKLETQVNGVLKKHPSTVDDELFCCLAINTAEQLWTLGKDIHRTLHWAPSSAIRDEVDFAMPCTNLARIAVYARDALVQLVKRHSECFFTSMRSIDWKLERCDEDVDGSPSPYMDQLGSFLTERYTLHHKFLLDPDLQLSRKDMICKPHEDPTSHFVLIHEAIVTDICMRFKSVICECQRISCDGADQLATDLHQMEIEFDQLAEQYPSIARNDYSVSDVGEYCTIELGRQLGPVRELVSVLRAPRQVIAQVAKQRGILLLPTTTDDMAV